jgi:uncharacterized glyoxalase superfamily protein PhnB
LTETGLLVTRVEADRVIEHTIPTLRYADAPTAIDWLCEAFGFERHLVVEGDDGAIDHAQLVHGEGMVMLGSVRPNDYNDLVTTVSEVGRPTSGIYVVVEDVDAHADRARELGADIVLEPVDSRTADVATRVATSRATSGVSATTTRGRVDARLDYL